MTAAVALGAVGVVVGVLSSRLAHLAIRDAARRRELSHLIAFIDESASGVSAEALGELACQHLVELLGLRRCEWLPGVQEAGGPMLLPSGALMGRLSELSADRAKLPQHLQIPVHVDGRQRGCFLASPDGDRVTSIEERRTAATVVALFGRAVYRAGP